MVGHHPVDAGLDGVGVGDVEGPDVELHPGRRRRRPQGPAPVGFAEGGHGPVAGAGGGHRGGQTDARRGAGDQEDGLGHGVTFRGVTDPTVGRPAGPRPGSARNAPTADPIGRYHPDWTVTSPNAGPPSPAAAHRTHRSSTPSTRTWSSDPFPLYADLRDRAPIHRNDLGFWVVTRHEDCLAILRDRRASSDSLNVAVERHARGLPDPRGRGRPGGRGHAGDAAVPVPGPARPHPAAGPGVQGLHPQGGRVTPGPHPTRWSTSCSTPPSRPGEVDLLEAFAYPLPVRVICDLLGVPAEDQDRFKGWSNALARGLDPDFLLTEEVIAARGEAVLQFAQYFFELLAERRQPPGRRPAQPAGGRRGRGHAC